MHEILVHCHRVESTQQTQTHNCLITGKTFYLLDNCDKQLKKEIYKYPQNTCLHKSEANTVSNFIRKAINHTCLVRY